MQIDLKNRHICYTYADLEVVADLLIRAWEDARIHGSGKQLDIIRDLRNQLGLHVNLNATWEENNESNA